jgi:hypothetical protein
VLLKQAAHLGANYTPEHDYERNILVIGKISRICKLSDSPPIIMAPLDRFQVGFRGAHGLELSRPAGGLDRRDQANPLQA